MAATTRVGLTCDPCGWPLGAGAAPTAQAVQAARWQARDKGWHWIAKRNRDVCDVCWTAGRR